MRTIEIHTITCGRCYREFEAALVLPMGVARCKTCEELEAIARATSNAVIKQKIRGVPGLKNTVLSKQDLVKEITQDLANDRYYLEEAKRKGDAKMTDSFARQVKELEEALGIARKFL